MARHGQIAGVGWPIVSPRVKLQASTPSSQTSKRQSFQASTTSHTSSLPNHFTANPSTPPRPLISIIHTLARSTMSTGSTPLFDIPIIQTATDELYTETESKLANDVQNHEKRVKKSIHASSKTVPEPRINVYSDVHDVYVRTGYRDLQLYDPHKPDPLD